MPEKKYCPSCRNGLTADNYCESCDVFFTISKKNGAKIKQQGILDRVKKLEQIVFSSSHDPAPVAEKDSAPELDQDNNDQGQDQNDDGPDDDQDETEIFPK